MSQVSVFIAGMTVYSVARLDTDTEPLIRIGKLIEISVVVTDGVAVATGHVSYRGPGCQGHRLIESYTQITNLFNNLADAEHQLAKLKE